MFFGGGQEDIENYTVDGKNLDIVACKLLDDIGKQFRSLFAFILGHKALKLGLRKEDRDINSRLKRYKQCLRDFIEKRLESLKKGELSIEEKKQDYVERMYRSLEGSDITEEFIEDLIGDFSMMLIAGTETTST